MDVFNEIAEVLKQNLHLLAIIAIMSLLFHFGKDKKSDGPQAKRVNHKIKLDNPKVVDTVKCADMEDLAQYKDGKVVMCRCWKSETFPYCDGSHVKHNKETGDNVGPLIVQK